MRKVGSKTVLLSADNQLFQVSLDPSQGQLTACLKAEVGDELDPVMFINKVSYRKHQVVLLTKLSGTIVAYDLTTDLIVGSCRVQSAVNCLGSLHRSSGFRLGVTLLQIGNLTTPALSDNKCVLYAVNLPCLLRGLYPLPELESLLPLLEQIIDTVLENLRTDHQRAVSSLDLDLLVN